MNIAIIGYGRMGKTVERIAIERGHQITYIHQGGQFNPNDLSEVDVAIEFTQPEAAKANVLSLLEMQIPVISGTTGWLEEKGEADAAAQANQVGFLYASNFSLGVNLFFVMNERLARLLSDYPEYVPSIHEIHHTGKKDAPSGTAITAAEGVLASYDNLDGWTMSEENGKIEISSERIDPYFGTHEVNYKSPIDTISLKHEANSREGFALGAVIAAEWIPGKVGAFDIRDVLGL